jgi:hypothetical protein
MLKPLTKGVMEGAAQPKSAAPRITRSGTMAAAKQQRVSALTESDDVAPPVSHKTFSTTIITLQPIVEALNKILDGNGSTVDTIRGIFRYIGEMERVEGQWKEGSGPQEEVSGICKLFQKDLQEVCIYLDNKPQGVQNMVNATLETSEKALKVAEELKETTADMVSGVGKVTNTVDKIVDTTQSYRNVLMSRQPPSNKASVDPKVLYDMEHKDKQILIDIFDEEGASTMSKGLMELLDKANKVLDSIKDGVKPELVKVESLHKTKKNVILLMLNSKEVANWLREVKNEVAFVNSFSKGAHIRDREYNLVVPRIPLTFEPSNVKHLREVEESNDLPLLILQKARWIKPEGHRRQGQMHAFTILTVTLVDAANKLIRNGINVCGSHSRPSKQKIEPI